MLLTRTGRWVDVPDVSGQRVDRLTHLFKKQIYVTGQRVAESVGRRVDLPTHSILRIKRRWEVILSNQSPPNDYIPPL